MRPDKLRAVALLSTLLVPLGLLHAFVLAEICIAITDILFLAEATRTRNFAWARNPWFIAALIWWAWLLLCSTPNPWHDTAGWKLGFTQALVILRLIIFVAALQSWVFTTQTARRLGWAVLAASALWVGLEAWQQYLTGRNIFGDPRFADGSLTGPFWKPRAGDLYAHILFAALLPVVLPLLARRQTAIRVAGFALVLLGVVTAVLIGQRMGSLLTLFGLLIAAFFIPVLRRIALVAIAAGILFLLATPLISPPTWAKLIGESSRNFSHFALSPYGEIFTRATIMGLRSPIFGWGYNGYRALCPQPRFDGGLPFLGIAPTRLDLFACIQHPQNYYIQAFADAGFPGLALFILSMAIFFYLLAKGLLKSPSPLRVGLLISFATFAWPIESTDAFPTLYMLGWMYYVLGLGLALTQLPATPSKSEPNHV